MSTLTAIPSLSGTTEFAVPEHESFYTALTARNRGLVSERDQQLLREARIVVAGCGSIGGAVVEPLLRLGAEHMTLAEPDVYELHNLNRQHARLADVGVNKAEGLADWVTQVNPYAVIDVDTTGVTAENATDILKGAALVFDGIDVTSKPSLACKYLLHQVARRAGVPVVSGYDIAGVQLVIVADYRDPHVGGLTALIGERTLPNLTPLQFLARVVPLRALPVEMLPELRRQQSDPNESFPQLVYSARMFGVLAARLSLDLLAGRPVRERIIVDVNAMTRPAAERSRVAALRLFALARIAPTALAYRRRTTGQVPEQSNLCEQGHGDDQ